MLGLPRTLGGRLRFVAVSCGLAGVVLWTWPACRGWFFTTVVTCGILVEWFTALAAPAEGARWPFRYLALRSVIVAALAVAEDLLWRNVLAGAGRPSIAHVLQTLAILIGVAVFVAFDRLTQPSVEEDGITRLFE